MSAKEVWVLLSIYAMILICFIVVIVSSAAAQGDTPDIKKFGLSHAPGPLRFQLIGDFGDLDSTDKVYNGENPVQAVAQRMSSNTLVRPISLVISSGDNRYDSPDSFFDQIIYRLMNHIFDKGGLKSRPWYLVLGNHDCEIDPQFEIDANDLYPQ